MKEKLMEYSTHCLGCGWHVNSGVPYGTAKNPANATDKTILNHLLECPKSGPVVLSVKLA